MSNKAEKALQAWEQYAEAEALYDAGLLDRTRVEGALLYARAATSECRAALENPAAYANRGIGAVLCLPASNRVELLQERLQVSWASPLPLYLLD